MSGLSIIVIIAALILGLVFRLRSGRAPAPAAVEAEPGLEAGRPVQGGLELDAVNQGARAKRVACLPPVW